MILTSPQQYRSFSLPGLAVKSTKFTQNCIKVWAGIAWRLALCPASLQFHHFIYKLWQWIIFFRKLKIVSYWHFPLNLFFCKLSCHFCRIAVSHHFSCRLLYNLTILTVGPISWLFFGPKLSLTSGPNWPCRCLDCIGIQSVQFWHCWGFQITRASEQPPERSFVSACEIAQFTLLFRVLCPVCIYALCVWNRTVCVFVLCESVWVCTFVPFIRLICWPTTSQCCSFSGWTASQWVGDPNLKHKELKTFTQKGAHW